MKNAIEDPITTVVVPPCPAWCRETAGHDYDSVDPTTGTIERHHSWDAPDIGEEHRSAWASINACETALDGVVTLHAAYILVSADGEMTAEQARGYSAELLVAADKLDEINSGAK